MCEESTISEDEKAVYDRQIRLWGLEAQSRLRNSTVLIVGLSGCGSEVAKNLMLAGLKSLTLLDNQAVNNDDYCSQFLLQLNSEGKNRAEASRQRCQVLNPDVELRIDTGNVVEKDGSFFSGFDLVILVDQEYSIVNQINKICRKAKKPKVPKVMRGGALDSDLNELGPSVAKRPKIEVDLENGNKTKGNDSSENVVLDDDDDKVTVAYSYPLWEDAWNVDWSHKKFLRKAKRILPRSYFPVRVMLRMQGDKKAIEKEKFMEMWKKELEECNHFVGDEYFEEKYIPLFIGPQLSPACAIVGAHMAQEAIKVLSQKDDPLRNVFLYSAIDTSGIVCHLPPAT